MKKWIALALCLVLALSLTACGEKKAGDTGDLLSQIKEKGEIVVAMEGTWAPGPITMSRITWWATMWKWRSGSPRSWA